MQCDLVYWTHSPVEEPIHWEYGEVVLVEARPDVGHSAVGDLLEHGKQDAVLFWDQRIPLPPAALVRSLLQQPVDLWHAGLLLGTAGLPEIVDFLSPGWMYNRDPEATARAVSWRVSLAACLVRSRVLRKLGHIDPAFETLSGAALDMGYRLIWKGAVTVFEPGLLSEPGDYAPEPFPIHDNYLFAARNYQAFWRRYVLFRELMGLRNWKQQVDAFRRVAAAGRGPFADLSPGLEPLSTPGLDQQGPAISVLIPTLCRYPFLESTLSQLAEQTVRPFEVICIDQTPHTERQPGLYEKFDALNLRVIWMDEPGQCSARNAGLDTVRGSAVLFLDDDVEVPPDYIEKLVDALRLGGADSAQGVWSQGEAAAISPVDRIFRVSDRFATGNSLTWFDSLKKVGGFDLNYNRNYRADADLGMRLYLSGALLLITPYALENSLSPPTGGLKFFGAIAGFGGIGLFKPWPAITQTYYWMRYFSPRQVREALLLTFIAATIPIELRYSIRTRGKIVYLLRSLWKTPFRLIGIFRSLRAAKALMREGPKISAIRVKAGA